MKMSVVVQAGGESKRMGRDKGLVPFLGQPLVQRVIERIGPVADEILVTSNSLDAYRFLGIPIFPDIIPGRGSLSGLYTAFCSAKYPLVAVVACDMVFASAKVFAAEKELILSSSYDGIVPQTDYGFEPFHSVYLKEPCVKAVKAALENGQKRADCWFSRVNIGFLPSEQLERLDPCHEAFINLNTPEELLGAELLASKQKDQNSTNGS